MTLTLSGTSGRVEAALPAILAGHEADAYGLPGSFLEAVTAADALGRRAQILGLEHSSLVHGGGLATITEASQAALLQAARKGTVPEAAAGAVAAAYARITRLEVEVPFIGRVARQAGLNLEHELNTGAGRIATDYLEPALEATLAAARTHAPALGGVDLGATLMDAPGEVQTAYRALVPLASRYDLILRGVAALWSASGSERRADDGPQWIDPFLAGPGLVDRRREHPSGVAFDPAGHPVARLVAAATAAVAQEA